MSLTLGLETTCDETSAAVVADGVRVCSTVVRSQIELHARYGGVVPEIAARAHLEILNAVISRAMEEAGVTAEQLNGVGVANCPGLIGCLLVGVAAAKALAFAWEKPLVGVNHVHAHLYATRLQQGTDIDVRPPTDMWPALGLVISGGHTSMYWMDGFTQVRRIGATIDDAVGEAFDKVAQILQLGYPGGPLVEQLAQRGNPGAIQFPKSLLGRDSLDFSFSGLKTAVLYHVNGNKGIQHDASSLSPQELADVAASFQRAAADVLAAKCRRALDRQSAKSLLVGGGVSANKAIRSKLLDLGREMGLQVLLPAPEYCTDNAAMIAGLAAHELQLGHQHGLNLPVLATV